MRRRSGIRYLLNLTLVWGRDNWRIVQFGGKSDKEEYVNKRAEMWFAMKEWLVNGGCIDNEALADELVAPEACAV